MRARPRTAPLSLRAIGIMISSSFAADRWGSILLCLANPAQMLAPAAGAVATKVLLDSAIDGEVATAVLAGVLAALAVALTLATSVLSIYLVHATGEKIDAYIERQLAERIARLPGIEHYERADYLDEVQMLRDQSDTIGAGLNALSAMFARVCQVVLVCALLAAQSPLLLLLPLFALPSFFANGLSTRLDRRAHEQSAEPDRLLHRFVGLMSDLPVAREARLFGLGEEFRHRRRDLAANVDRIQGRALYQSTVLGWGGDVIFAIGYFGAILLVMNRAVRGELSAGDVAMIVVLAGQVQGFVSGLVGGVRFMAVVYVVAARMDWLRRYDEEHRPAPATAAVPSAIRDGISIRNLTFRYPGTDVTVLDGISMELPAGSVVALVGDNGAGKSSLVKLLLRFYEPTNGRILVDGVDLAEIDLDQWRRHASGAFQDFCRFEFRARESIGLGDVDRIEDTRAAQAAARRAGATEVLESLPSGPETQLGAGWDGGIDLSGGQWQRIALARGRMRERTNLLVLDEPTAALDAQAEHALFERFAGAAREAADTGGVTLVVTHRFSTVRMADRIVVLDGGRIRESGSHEELVGRADLYAELFDLQAGGYR